MKFSYGSAPSKWTGKLWNVLGDSITEHNGTTSLNYQDYIAQKIGCKVINYGISGTGWRTPSVTAGTNAFYQRISTMDPSADLITIFGGTNDWAEVGVAMTLGVMGDTATTTFYGAVDNVLSNLVTNYPTKTIAVFTPLHRSDAYYNLQHGTSGVSMMQVADAIIAVANKYNIPSLDLYRYGNMYVWNTAFKNAIMPGGLHPNDAGHKILADKILAFLNKI